MSALSYSFLLWLLHVKYSWTNPLERLWYNRHNMLDGFMHSYEAAKVEVTKLKQDYLHKMRRADEAEDE